MYDDDREEPVDGLIATCIDAHRNGRKAEFESLVEQHPQYESEIASVLDDYDRIESKFAPLRTLLNSGAVGPAEIPTLGRSDAAIPPVPQAGNSFGDYELLAEVSRGGMGVVFKARQQSLGRIVALKMLLDGGESSTDHERFLVEARAVARLSHPHIVPIYEVGEHGGRPFFTMEFVAGGSLRERIDELRGDQRAIARLMMTVARAVEHAHRRGILHRDLKPGNVLLDERREPHVTDFGLAKRLDEESALTQDGAIVGTPSYMAPEQAQAASDLSTAVDVYGLGAVLYELLTGRPPIKGETVVETMMKARTQSPTAPRKVVAEVDPDLEAICVKSLEREPQARYSSAARFADDLERWLDGKPIHARNVSLPERLLKWGRRQPLLAAAAATITVACLGLLVLGGFLWNDAEQRAAAVKNLDVARTQLKQIQTDAQSQQQRADAVRRAADQAEASLQRARRDALHTQYAADMLLVHAAWEGDNLTAVSDLLGRYENVAGKEDVRGFEWHYLSRQLHGARLSWRDTPDEKGSQGSILGTAISPDGKILATAQMGSKIKLWNLADGRLLQEIESSPGDAAGKNSANVAGLFFADEGRKLVAITRKAPSRQEGNWRVSAAAGAALLASPNLLSASSPNGVALAESAISPARRSEATRAIAEFFNSVANRDQLRIDALADSLEYKTFALSERTPPRVEPFDPVGLQTTVLPLLSNPFVIAHEGRSLVVLAVDRSHDGKFLALAGMQPQAPGDAPQVSGAAARGKIIVWDLVNDRIHADDTWPSPVTAVAFSADNKTLAIGNSDGVVSLLSPDFSKPPRVLPGQHGWIYSLHFARDGSRLASGARDGLVILWDVAEAKEVARLRGHTSAVCRVELTPDGKTLVSGGIDGTIKVWDLAHVDQSLKLRGHETSIAGLAFVGGGEQLASIDLRGAARTWRLADGKLLNELKPNDIDDPLARVSMSAKTIAWKDKAADAIVVRDIATGRQTRFSWPDHLPAGPTISPDDRLLAAADQKGRGGLAIWNVANGRQVAAIADVKATAMARSNWAAFSPDAKLFACAERGGVLLWDRQAGNSRRILESKTTTTTAVAFSADGKLLAAAATDTTGTGIAVVRVWDLVADQLLCECRGAGLDVAVLAFSPDGRRLATGGTTSSQQGMLKLWDTTVGREVFSAQFPMAMITAVAFSADRRRLAAGVTPINWSKLLKDAPSEIYVWDATPLASDSPK